MIFGGYYSNIRIYSCYTDKIIGTQLTNYSYLPLPPCGSAKKGGALDNTGLLIHGKPPFHIFKIFVKHFLIGPAWEKSTRFKHFKTPN